jgi:Fe2+ transport system protein FeoA
LNGGIILTLRDLQVGKSAKVIKVGGERALRRRFLDMGITPNTVVSVRKAAPLGDPIELLIRGYVLTIRLEDAQKIEVEAWHDSGAGGQSEQRQDNAV